MIANEVLPWLNLLLVPMCWHILRTESRLTALETQLRVMLQLKGAGQGGAA